MTLSSDSPDDAAVNISDITTPFSSFDRGNTTDGDSAMEVLRGSVFVKATVDHKYEGIQVRYLTIGLARILVLSANETESGPETDSPSPSVFRESLLQLPVGLP